MLAKSFRLTQQKEFKKTYKIGKSASSSLFILKFVPNQKKTNCYAVVVSNKVSKKAVQRNKIRRQVKNWLKKKQTSLKTNFNIIIIAKPKAITADYSQIEEALQKLFSSRNLLKS